MHSAVCWLWEFGRAVGGLLDFTGAMVEEWNTRDLLRRIDDTRQTLEPRVLREAIA